MQKTGSQVLDSICISEAEKQAVLTLIREEVHSSITLIHQCCMSSVYLCIYFYFFTLTRFHSCTQFMLTGNVFFQIISKEAEVSDWKKKYEDCRKEVDEMRLEI